MPMHRAILAATSAASLLLASCASHAPAGGPDDGVAGIAARLAERSPAAVDAYIASSASPREWAATLRLPGPYTGAACRAVDQLVERSDAESFAALLEALTSGRAPESVTSDLPLKAVFACMLRNPSLDEIGMRGLESIATRRQRDELSFQAFAYLLVHRPERARRCMDAIGPCPLAWLERAELAAADRDWLEIEAALRDAIADDGAFREGTEPGTITRATAITEILTRLDAADPSRVGRWVGPIVRSSGDVRTLGTVGRFLVRSPELIDLLADWRTLFVWDLPTLLAVCNGIGRELGDQSAESGSGEAMQPVLRKALRWIVDALEDEATPELQHSLGLETLLRVAPLATDEALLTGRGWEGLTDIGAARLAASRIARGLDVPPATMASMRARAAEGVGRDLPGASEALIAIAVRPSIEDLSLLRAAAARAAPYSASQVAALGALVALGESPTAETIASLRVSADALRRNGSTHPESSIAIMPPQAWIDAVCSVLLATGDEADLRRIAATLVRWTESMPPRMRAAMLADGPRADLLRRAVADALRFGFLDAIESPMPPALLALLARARPDLAEAVTLHLFANWPPDDAGTERFGLLASRYATALIADGGPSADRVVDAICDERGMAWLASIGLNVRRADDAGTHATAALVARLRARPAWRPDLLALVDEAKSKGIEAPFRFPPSLLRTLLDGAEWRDAPPDAPRALILLPRSDHNGAYSLGWHSWKQLLDRGYAVWLVDVATDEDASRVHRRAAELGGADLIVYSGHGCPGFLAMSGDSANLISKRAALLDLTDEATLAAPAERPALRPGGAVILDSCKTGHGRGARANLANMMGRAYPQASRVFAAVEATRIDRLLFDSRDRVSGIRYFGDSGYELVGAARPDD